MSFKQIDETTLLDEISNLVVQNNVEQAIFKLNDLHPSDSIKLLEDLKFDYREVILKHLNIKFYSDSIHWMPDYLIQEIINIKGIDFIVTIIHENPDIDLTYFIVKDLDEHSKTSILEAVSYYKRKITEEKFQYPKDSAGRLMQSNFIRVLCDWNVSQCISYIKELNKNLTHEQTDTVYDIFIVDYKGVVKGSVSLYKILVANGNTKIVDIKNDNFKTIDVNLDQEEVALIFRNRGFVSSAVVDHSGVLLGSITIDEIIDVIYQETQEDLLLISGIQEGSKYKKIFYTAQGRLKWLSFNFIGVMIISLIVAEFNSVLSQNVLLAAVIQFVIAIGGNAGMQSLSVTLRGITLRIITKSNVLKQIGKEFIIAFLNGVVLGILGFTWSLFLGDGTNNITLGLIAFCAVFINVILGTAFGSMYPIILKKLKIDPAIASAICVTISTDIVGFFMVLLIANIML